MALPPCHAFFQFYVANKRLSCQLYQRSADLFLGVPFNIASYSILCMMIAKICDLKLGDFVHTLGDTHLYLNHLEQAKIQLERKPKKLPIMKINGNQKNINDFRYEDFELINYDPDPHIKAPVAIYQNKLKINLIVAASENNVIGKKNDLPWSLPNDMNYFKLKTLGHTVIMGRKNYISIPEKFRPLPNRENIILTTKKNFIAPKCKIFNSLENSIIYCQKMKKNEIFIIGGGEVYKYALEQNLIDTIYLTRVHTSLKGDTFFPKLNEKKWKIISEEKNKKDLSHKYDYSFIVLDRI